MALAKRFKQLDHFSLETTGAYNLLPFNFHKLTAEKYFCANLVGEHLFLTQQELKKLVGGTLPTSSDTYLELKSKHFLYGLDSDAAIDLLALKFRTKHHRIAQFTALHIFVVTLRCDYTCQYCQVSRRMEDEGDFDMSHESAEASLEMLFLSPAKSVKIEFQGGEPLLNFELIKFIVETALAKNISHQKNLEFVVTTNLSMLDEDVLDFCEVHGIYLSTSLDGPKDLHNRNRPKASRNGYETTVAGIRRIQERIGPDKISALMTTTAASIEMPREIIDTYVELKFHSIFLRPLSPYGFAIKTKQAAKYNSERWLEFFKEGLDYIIELNQAGYFLVEQYTRIILRKLLTAENPGYVDLQSPAGIGISVIVYNYDGDVYASDEARMLKEMGDEKFRLGNVHNDTYEQIFSADSLLEGLEETLVESVPMCSECGYQTLCGSDPVYHYATQGDVVGKKPLSFFCNKNMGVITHILNLLQEPKTRKTLESWI